MWFRVPNEIAMKRIAWEGNERRLREVERGITILCQRRDDMYETSEKEWVKMEIQELEEYVEALRLTQFELEDWLMDYDEKWWRENGT